MKSGDMLGGIASATNTVTGVVSGLASNQGTKLSLDAVKADNTVGKDNLKLAEANNNFYANIGVNFGFNKSSSKSNSHNESAVVTTIKGKDENSSITYNNVKNIEYLGTQAKDTKFIYNHVDNITKKAVELNNSYSSDSKSSGVSAGVNIGYGRKVLTDNASISASTSKSNMNSNGTNFQNGLFVNVDEVHNNTKNMTLSGFNQVGGKVTGNIENLTIESKQNTSSTTGSSKGGSLGFAPNGMPNSISANYSQTNGERKYVDNATTFLIGDGSNLKIGKVESTAAAIGTTENGKISIDEYVGHNLENKDETTTKGASLSLSPNSNVISGVGINYANKDLESVTKNTVVGNVEIGKSSGDEINKDLDTMTEITKDEDTKTNVFVESQTINYALNPEAFKEDIQKAKNEIHDIYHAVDSTVNPQGKESRNVLQQLAETRQAKTILNIVGSRLEIAENQEDIAKAFEGVSEDLGYKVKIIYTDPSNSPQLIGVDKDGNTYIKDGTAYVDKDTGINYILINSDSLANRTKAGVIGTIAEEQSHVIGKIEGRQKLVQDGSEKGLESLGRPTNDYFKNQFSKNDKAIGIVSDGKDYSNVDFGENVGDDIFDDLAHREALYFTLRDGAKRLTDDSLKVIEEKGIEYALDKGLVKYEATIHKKFAEEKAVKKVIEEKQKIAIQKSKEDPLYNYYLAVDGVSRKVTIEKELKPKSFGKNLKNNTSEAFKEGYNSVINSVPNYDKWQKTAKEYGEMESSLAGSALSNAVGNLITVPGRMATEMNLLGPGEIQYGPVKDIRKRQKELNDVTRGKADLLTTIVAYSTVESIKDSKVVQNLKNKFIPNEIPNISVEDEVSNVVNNTNNNLAKEYKNLVNSEKQKEYEKIKKSVNEIIKEQAGAKAEVLDNFTSEELTKFQKDLGKANFKLDEKTGAVIGSESKKVENIISNKNNLAYNSVQNGDISWKRGLIKVDELDSTQFSNLKNNGIVKVNRSGTDRPKIGAPNSFYSTGNGEHIFVYDNNGDLIYDLSKERVKSFKMNIDHMGNKYFKEYKLKGDVPDEIKKIYGW